MGDQVDDDELKAIEVAVPAATKNEIELYEHVVDAATLIAVHLQKLEFNVDPEFYGKSPELNYGVTNGKITFASEPGYAAIQVNAELTAKAGRKRLLLCKASYEVVYRGMTNCQETAVHSYLRRVGRFTAYPYFRALVGHLDGSAGTSLPPLPVLKEKVLPAKKRKTVEN